MTPPDFRKALEGRLEGLTPTRRELRALRDAHERLRDELVAEQERSKEVEAEHRAELRRMESAREKYKSERDHLSEQLQAIKESRSFVVGHAIMRTARLPLKGARKLVAFARRIVRGLMRRVVRPLGRGIARALRAVARGLRSLPGRIVRVVRRAARAIRSRGPKRSAAPAPAASQPGAPAQTATAAQSAAATPPAADEERVLSVPQGNKFLGPLTDGHATTMFLLWGLPDEEIDSLVDEVARLQLMQWDFKPLFVTDSDHWAGFQEHGFWFEYIPPADDWISHNDGGDWSQFVSERVDSIIAAYAPDRVVVYEDTAVRGALRRGVLNGVISAGDPVVEMTTTAKLGPPAGGNGAAGGAANGGSQTP